MLLLLLEQPGGPSSALMGWAEVEDQRCPPAGEDRLRSTEHLLLGQPRAGCCEVGG